MQPSSCVMCVVVLQVLSSTCKHARSTNTILFCWAVLTTFSWQICAQRWMNWRKVICAVHLMRVHMHVLPRSAPDECVLFHAARIRLLQLLTQQAHIPPCFPSATVLPLPQCTFWFTPPPLNAAFFSSVTVSFSLTWSLQLFTSSSFSFPLQPPPPPQ